MKRRLSLFTYRMMDMKAAEAELNRRAAAGWQMEKVWMGVLAVFVPAHVPVCYCIDWSDPGRDDGPGYRALLADAGWRLRQRVTCQNIYEAPAGMTPIQTGSGLEYRRFRDRALRRMGVGAVLLLGGLLWAGRLLLRLGQWRRGADGRTLPAPGRWSALAAAVCDLADRLVLGAACLTFLMDVVQSALRGGWLLLLAAHTSWIEEPYRVEFKEETYYTLEEKIADSWTLPWPWLADWTAEWCRRQLGAAGQPPLEGYEGVWHIRSGERTETADRGESGWVLQRGNTVFRMKNGALPDEMWLDEVLSRLEGET